MKLYKTIYLANPQDMNVDGPTKWDVVEGLNATFISGDSPFKGFEADECTHERWVELNDDCIQNWDKLYDSTIVEASDTIRLRVLENIDKCDALILYVDKPCKSTAILEVTYASTIGKPCYIIINNNNNMGIAEYEYDPEDDNSYNVAIKRDEYGKDIINNFGRIFESAWPILGLPTTYELRVNNIENAKETVRKLLLLESPIEAMLIHEIVSQQIGQFYTLEDIEPQFEVAGYRIDLAYPDKKLAIELDGHEYHKTKEQRKHDAKRDRALNIEGWRVIRFTGSEIYQAVWECLDEIQDHLHMGQKLKTFREIAQYGVENGQN